MAELYLVNVGCATLVVYGTVTAGLLHYTDEYKETGETTEFVPALLRDYSDKERKTMWRKYK